MRRGWYLLLALSLGLNAGLIYTTISARNLPDSSAGRESGSEMDLPHVSGPQAPLPGEPVPGGSGPGGPRPGDAPPGGPLQNCPPCALLIQDRMQRMCSTLKLSDEQHGRVRQALDEMLPRIFSERDAVRQIRALIQDEYCKPEIDAQAIRKLVGELTAAQTRLDSLTAETILRESALLTRDQRLDYFSSMPWERCRGCVPPGQRSGGPRGAR